MSLEVGSPLDRWCRRWLRSVPRKVLFEQGHLSRVIGVELSDGRQVVVKVRPDASRIEGCMAVQRHLFRIGYPCPEPLTGPAPWDGDLTASAERLVEGNTARAIDERSAAVLAELLATLVAGAPDVAAVPGLEPPPPWVGWAHDSAGVWPPPDDLDVNLNDQSSPAWINELAVRLRARLLDTPAHRVIGHVDWESQNIRWIGASIVSVDDWDSVAALREEAIAGAASTVFPSSADGTVRAATVRQTEAFLGAYRRARGVDWNAEQLEIAWAAGLWVLAYNARKEFAGGGAGYVQHLGAEITERGRRAGL